MFTKKNNQSRNFYFMDLAKRQAQYILGNTEFNEDQIAAADLTQDGVVNILDVIAMMSMITTPLEVVSDFLYEDINVNSETFGELVGPPIYEGMISCYYFGKAG